MYLPSRINASTFVTSTLRPALTPSLLLKTQIVLPASTIALMIFVCIYVTGSQAAPARSQDQTTPAPVVAREDIPQALAAAIQEARLQAGDAAADDHFGLSVALSSDGNTALVGALDDDNSGGANAGSAYVFTRSGTTWTQQTRLQASDPSAEDHFGISVALSADGNTALVGADSDDNVGVDAGSAYVFTRSGAIWTEQSRLQAGDAAEDDNFGNAVALSSDGSTALVGALFDDHSGRNFAGSAYVFTRSGTTWAEQARLQASNHTNGAIFGVAVALSADGNTALVGAFFGDSSSGVGTGSAYVFIRSGATWAEQARLESSDAANADRFGEAVVLSADGNTALIGAPFDDNSGGTNAGSAYVFTRSGTAWSQQTKLIAGGAAPGDQFGLAVALGSDDGIALIGAPSDDDSGTNAGSAYIFNRSGETWAEQGRLVSSDIAPADFFGISVALSSDGNIALFGASADDNSGGTNAGSAYTFFGLSPVEAGQLLISEFRLRGPNGANDEFVEIFNNTDAPITILAQDGSAGFALVASDGVARCTIPNGTVIPTRGHYLCVNSVGYSLASYPAGNGTTATGDATYTTDIPDNAGIALFQTSLSAGFTLANRLDAVGSTSEANTLYKEGTGYPALTPFSIDYSFYRDNCGKSGSITTFGNCPSTGTLIDTDNNASNFVFVDTNGTSAGAGQRLGAPGPENLSSPIQRNASFTSNLLDPCVGSASPPNRVRDFTSDPSNNSTFGTLDIRRTYTNNTGGNVTRLRFRIIDITTFPAPSGIADLRPRTSTAVVVTVDRAPCGSGTSNVTVQGTTLEQPPSQPNGGGFNSSMSAGTVTLATPLANGASIDLRFLLGIQQTGNFKFYINIEALP